MKKIIDHAPNYSISINGIVINESTGRELKHDLSAMYPRVRLGKYGGKHHIYRLIANAFIPNHDNKPQVNHKDGNKHNNNIDNLEWVTASENMQHAVDTGLKPRTTERHQKALKKALTGRPATQKMIDNMRAVGESVSKMTIDDASEICEAYATGLFTQRELAENAGVSLTRINQVIHNKWRTS